MIIHHPMNSMINLTCTTNWGMIMIFDEKEDITWSNQSMFLNYRCVPSISDPSEIKEMDHRNIWKR